MFYYLFLSIFNHNFLSIYLINSITYTTPPPHPQFKFRSIRKQKTGTRLEQLEQTRPPLQNYRSLTPWLIRPCLLYYSHTGRSNLWRVQQAFPPMGGKWIVWGVAKRWMLGDGRLASTCVCSAVKRNLAKSCDASFRYTNQTTSWSRTWMTWRVSTTKED